MLEVTAERAPIASAPITGPASVDARFNSLYAAEQRTLSVTEVFRLLRKIWPFVDEHRRLMVFKAILAFSSLTFYLLTPWPMKIIIDNVINRRPLSGLPRAVLDPLTGGNPAAILIAVTAFLVFALIFIGVKGDAPTDLNSSVASGGLDQAGFTSNDANSGWSLWSGLFGLCEVRLTLELTQRMNQSLRTAVYHRFLRAPLHMFGDQKIGDAVFRVMHDSSAIGTVLYEGLFAPLMSGTMFVIALVVLSFQFRNEPLIPILAAIALPAIALVSGLFGRRLRDQGQDMRERGSDVMAAFEERIAQVQLIKVFGQENRESATIDRISWDSFRAFLKLLVIGAVATLIGGALMGLLFGYAFYHLMLEVIHNKITLGDIVLLNSYTFMLVIPMINLGSTWSKIQAPIAGLRRMQSVFDQIPNEPVINGGAATLSKPISSIEFQEVSVGYRADLPVLRNVNAKLAPGQLWGLAGASGCGKSTLIYTIPRLLDPIGGAVLLNSTDIGSLDGQELRRRVGFVFQQEALFATTIEDNIRYGAPEASTDDVRRAAAAANATEFIDNLPEGYHTMLGRRGARLSVGQKQRIAIARVLLRNPDVLILDEPTAPLDPASEAALMRTLTRLARERIVLIVAHRPETLDACDRVVFIHGGTINAIGAHREMMKSNAAYVAYLTELTSEMHA